MLEDFRDHKCDGCGGRFLFLFPKYFYQNKGDLYETRWENRQFKSSYD